MVVRRTNALGYLRRGRKQKCYRQRQPVKAGDVGGFAERREGSETDQGHDDDDSGDVDGVETVDHRLDFERVPAKTGRARLILVGLRLGLEPGPRVVGRAPPLGVAHFRNRPALK